MKKKNNNDKTKRYMSIFLIIFLVSSIGGVMLYAPEDTSTFTLSSEYGKFKFTQRTDAQGIPYFDVSTKDRQFITYYAPGSLYLNIPVEVKAMIKDKSYFYFTFNPNEEDLSVYDYLRYDLRNNIPTSKFFIDSVTEQNPSYLLPLVTCNNATMDSPVIHFMQTNTTSITLDGQCINIKFEKYNALMVRDELIYLFNGIGG